MPLSRRFNTWMSIIVVLTSPGPATRASCGYHNCPPADGSRTSAVAKHHLAHSDETLTTARRPPWLQAHVVSWHPGNSGQIERDPHNPGGQQEGDDGKNLQSFHQTG